MTPTPSCREVELRTPDFAPLRERSADASASDRDAAVVVGPVAPISVTMLTRNSERLLAQALGALQWCDEIVVLDHGSTDRTTAIAVTFRNVSLHRYDGPFPGFGPAHREAVALARHDWILSVDSDEIVSPELAAEITTLPLDPGAVYEVRFRNYYHGRLITTSGWSSERHERLFNRRATNFCGRAVHEHILTAGLKVVTLRHAIDHYSIGEADDFLRKTAFYARLWADQQAGRKAGGTWKALWHGGWSFFRSLVLERGFLQGGDGLVISVYNAQTAFWKYVMLRDAARRLR